VINSKFVITRTLFVLVSNVMHILDIFVVWLLTIVYVIGTHLLNDVVMYSVCYFICHFIWMSIIDN